MLPWRRDHHVLSLIVGAQAGALLRRSARGGGWQLCQAYEGAWGAALPQALSTWTADLTSAQRVDVCVDASVAQHWISQAPQGARSLSEVQAYAMARRLQLFGDGDAQTWEMRADWHASRPFLCVAMPESLMTLIQAWCEAGRKRWVLRSELTALVSMAAPAWQGASWWSVGTPSISATGWLDEGTSVNHVRTWLAQDALASDERRIEMIRTELGRVALRAGIEPPSNWVDMSWDGQGYVVCRRDMQGANRTVLRSLSGSGLSVPVSLRSLTALACLHGGVA